MCSGSSVRSLLLVAILGLGACAPDVVCAPEGRLCTAAGELGVGGFNGDASATESWLFYPSAVDLDAEGELVICDFNNMRVRRLEPEGTLRTLVGTGRHAYATPGAEALDTPMENPVDVRVGPEGRPWIAELHAGRILHIDAAGTLQIVAGTGAIGFAGDGGAAVDADLSESGGLAVASDGTLYIADTDNHVIRQVDPSGIITTLAGTPGTAGFSDGSPGALDGPQKVRLHDGSLWVADPGNHAVRRLDLATGELHTVAGDGTAGYGGDGGPAAGARLREPFAAVGLDDGGVLIADSGNHVIRHVDAEGTIRTLIGTGEPGTQGDGRRVDQARLQFPADVLADGHGGVYVADMLNNAVRHAAGVLPTAP